MIDYAFFCIGLVGFAIFMYVILDGFDLGVGILFPYFSEQEQDIALKTIAPMWDGNETWLILGGAVLLATFPVAYSVLLPAMYIPLMVMLCALVARGVAFEFRGKATSTKHIWARLFFFASLLATFCQGLMLGTYIQVSYQEVVISAKSMLWLSPFAALCGIGLCYGYALLGAGWLVSKTTASLQSSARHLAINLYISAFVMLIAVTLITPMVNPNIARFWFSDAFVYLMPLPIASSLLLAYAFYKTIKMSDYWPFYGGVLMFLGCYIGLGISLYPNLLPGQSYVELAAHPSSLKLTFYVSLVLMPILLAYTGYAYWVFRGKVKSDDTFYH